MERHGEQWTQMRAAIFDALASFDQPASAYDSANLARRVESANAYVANEHPDCLHDCIFLICDQCGQTTHLDDDSLSGGVRAAATRAGFAPERPVIEVRGRCHDCESH